MKVNQKITVCCQVRTKLWGQVRDQIDTPVLNKFWDDVRDKVKEQIFYQVQNQIKNKIIIP